MGANQPRLHVAEDGMDDRDRPGRHATTDAPALPECFVNVLQLDRPERVKSVGPRPQTRAHDIYLMRCSET